MGRDRGDKAQGARGLGKKSKERKEGMGLNRRPAYLDHWCDTGKMGGGGRVQG